MAINKPSDWENVQATQERVDLPLDAYICRIRQSAVRSYNKKDGGSFDRLDVAFDICEGEYSEFYQGDFNMQPDSENKKWKGVLRLYLPTDDGSQQDAWTKSRFKAFTDAVEASNLGYKWNWDETSLKNRQVGIVFRNEQWVFEGKSGWKVQPFKAISVDRVKSGNYKLPKDKPHKDAENISIERFDGQLDENDFRVIDDNEDLPF